MSDLTRNKMLQGGVGSRSELVSARLNSEVAPYGFESAPTSGAPLNRILRRWRRTVIFSVLAGIALGVFITALQAPTYQARASLEIQSLNDNFLNMKQIVPVDNSDVPGTFSDLQTQIKIIESESVLDPVQAKMISEAKNEGVAREVSLRIQPLVILSQRLRGIAYGNKEQASDDVIGSEINRLFSSLKVRAIGQTRIIELTAESRYPNLASEFLSKICTEYISKNMDARWEMSQRTSQSLGRLLEDTRDKLRQAETALQNYASKSGLIFTSDKQNVAKEKLSQLQQEFSQAQATRFSAQSRYEVAKKVLAGDDFSDSVADSPIRDYKERLTELQRQRAELATTYTPSYAKIRRLDSQISYLQSAIKGEEQHEFDHIQNEYNAAARREALLADSYREQSRIVSDANAKEIQYNILRQDVEGNQQLYDEMLKQVKQAAISTAVRSSNVRILDGSKTPQFPHGPVLIVNCGLGVLLCLAFGLAAGFVKERADSTLKEPGEGQYYLGLPELGALLHDRDGRGLLRLTKVRKQLSGKSREADSNGFGKLVRHLTTGAPLSLLRIGEESGNSVRAEQAASLEVLWPQLRDRPVYQESYRESRSLLTIESCRAVVASLLLPIPDGKLPRSVVVTSPGPREGKSTVVANVGLTLASTGRRVLLVDGDLRRPHLHALFGLKNDYGLSVLLQWPRGSDCNPMPLIQHTNASSLSVLTTGPTPCAGANFLLSPNLSELLLKLEENFDVVLIDTPPVLQLADARVLGRLARGVLLVVRAGQTAREAAVAACERLEADSANVLGMILNDWSPSSNSQPYWAEYSRGYR
jgi:polysaccharide biosynthesis transport protein